MGYRAGCVKAMGFCRTFLTVVFECFYGCFHCVENPALMGEMPLEKRQLL